MQQHHLPHRRAARDVDAPSATTQAVLIVLLCAGSALIAGAAAAVAVMGALCQ